MRQHKARLRHRFDAAGQHQVRLPGANGIIGVHRAHHAGRAEHIHGVAVHLRGDPGLDGRMPRHQLAVPMLENVAKNIEVEFAGIDPCARHGRPHHVRTQIYRRNILERPPKLADRGAGSGDDIGGHMHTVTFLVRQN